jgi:hypothetical protein
MLSAGDDAATLARDTELATVTTVLPGRAAVLQGTLHLVVLIVSFFLSMIP